MRESFETHSKKGTSGWKILAIGLAVSMVVMTVSVSVLVVFGKGPIRYKTNADGGVELETQRVIDFKTFKKKKTLETKIPFSRLN